MLKEIVVVPVQNILLQAGSFISALAAVILILLVGWIIAKMVKSMVIRILDIFQIDSTAEKVGVDKILSKGGIKYSISELIGVLCYWLIMLITLIIAIGTVNLNQQAATVLNTIVLYIPKVISAIFILVLGAFFASFVNSAVKTAAANVGIGQANILGKIAQVLIIVFAVAITFEQLQIGSYIISMGISVLLASLGLGLALAFGLGCKDIAGKVTQDMIDKLKSKK